MTTWRSGAQTAALVSRMVAVSDALHRTLGAAADHPGQPAATVLFDELSLQHAWHAELLTERLPRRAGVERAELTVLGRLAEPMAMLAELADGGDVVGVAAAYRLVVLPRLIEHGGDLAAGCSDAAERSLRRSLSFVALDLSQALARSGSLLVSLTADEGAEAHAGRVASDLSSAVATAAGGPGLGS
jgi:hypothetical protein